MDEFNKIRKAFFKDGLSINEIAIKYRRSWKTINTIVNTSRDDLEERGGRSNRDTSNIITEPVINAVLAYFEKERVLQVKKKQKYTAIKIFTDLRASGLYKGSRRSMEALVRKLRREYGQSKQETYLPLEFELGSSLQMDHGEVDCIIGQERMTCYLFVASVPGKTLRYSQLFPIKTREAWGEFHERTFRFFGGIFLKVVYDNDTVLIKISGGHRLQTDFSLHLEEHYGFESHFCNLASGNEKGSVENGVGYCRRTYLSGCPVFEHFSETNSYLEKKCHENITHGVHYRTEESLSDIMMDLSKNLRPLLPSRNWQKRDTRIVNSYQQVEIENHFYSVPENLVGSSVRISIGAFFVNIIYDEKLVVQHPRKFGKGEDSLLLEHYLNQLERKPGALWDCKAAKELVLEADLQEIRKQLEARYPSRQAKLELIKILYLKKSYDQVVWTIALKKAIECQSFESAAIESILRMMTTPQQESLEEEVRNKLPHVPISTLEFDLSPYAILSQGGSTC